MGRGGDGKGRRGRDTNQTNFSSIMMTEMNRDIYSI